MSNKTSFLLLLLLLITFKTRAALPEESKPFLTAAAVPSSDLSKKLSPAQQDAPGRKDEASKAPAGDTPLLRPYEKEPSLMPMTISNFPFVVAYIILVTIIIALLVFLVNLKNYEKHMEDKRKEQ